MSDLHVDAAAYELPATPPDIDCIIIAGDVADGHERSARWLREQAVPRGLPVVYVAGNHDFYGHDLGDDGVELYRQAGVELLHSGNQSIDIAGARIVGQTMWTDYAIADDVDAARAWARQEIPDLRSIDCGLRRILTRDLLDTHVRHVAMIELQLVQPFAGPTMVVTHHAPHENSLRSMILTPADGSYASDLTAVIETYQPKIWVHGHTHHSRNYQIDTTRVVCNARGYDVTDSSGKPIGNPDFNPSLTLEI